jgi:hypothetical protein
MMKKSKPKKVRREKQLYRAWTEEESMLLEAEVTKYDKLSSFAWEAISTSLSSIHSVNRSATAVSIFLFLG